MTDAGKAPIVLFAYARPWHTEMTLRSLMNSDGADTHDLIVRLDGAKSSRDAGPVAEVARLVSQVATAGPFRSVTLVRSERNRGLARSVIRGVSDVLDRYAAVIVIEDDLLLAKDFLRYMDEALAVYADDERIWSVSGFTPALRSLENYSHDAYLSLRASSWGWGTWRRSWALVDWDVDDYNRFEYDLADRRSFNRGGRDLAAMLDAQMDGRVDSWAIRWCYSQFRHSMYSVVPALSRVRNIGLDGSGTHGVVEDPGPDLPVGGPVHFEPLELDPRILQDFARDQARYNRCPPYSFARHLVAQRRRSEPRPEAMGVAPQPVNRPGRGR